MSCEFIERLRSVYPFPNATSKSHHPLFLLGFLGESGLLHLATETEWRQAFKHLNSLVLS